MILDNLYANEIRFSIVTEWDAGYRVRLGSEYGGFAATATVNTFAEAYERLALASLARGGPVGSRNDAARRDSHRRAHGRRGGVDGHDGGGGEGRGDGHCGDGGEGGGDGHRGGS